jgi:hypothetical protein
MSSYSFRILIFLTVGVLSELHAQNSKPGWVMRYVNSIIKDTTAAEKATFTVYPTFASSPETKLELGLSAMKLFYAKGDTMNRLSELQAFTFVTLKAQYGIKFENAIYGDQDKWFFLGETKIQKFPLSYFGIGPETHGKNPALVDAFQVSINQRILKKIAKNYFIGPDVEYQLLSGVDFRQPAEGTPYTIPRGGNGTQNLGLGLSFVYDSRHNVLNVRKGLFGEISYLGYNKNFISDYSFGTLNLEMRSFHPIKRNHVLAWQVKGQFMNGDVPFQQMALLGGEKLMRGYYLGRFRDNNVIAAQAEYRILPFRFSKRLGAAVFASAGAVAPSVGEFHFRNVQVAGGLGLRYLLFPKKDIYLRFDVGFTREGMNLYVANGEAF